MSRASRKARGNQLNMIIHFYITKYISDMLQFDLTASLIRDLSKRDIHIGGVKVHFD